MVIVNGDFVQRKKPANISCPVMMVLVDIESHHDCWCDGTGHLGTHMMRHNVGYSRHVVVYGQC